MPLTSTWPFGRRTSIQLTDPVTTSWSTGVGRWRIADGAGADALADAVAVGRGDGLVDGLVDGVPTGSG